MEEASACKHPRTQTRNTARLHTRGRHVGNRSLSVKGWSQRSPRSAASTRRRRDSECQGPPETAMPRRSDAATQLRLLLRRTQSNPLQARQGNSEIQTQRRTPTVRRAHQGSAPTSSASYQWLHISGGWVRLVASGRPTCSKRQQQPDLHSNVTRRQRRWSTAAC
jgi:hypothetical protein